jgi:hypothetical protein
MRYAVRIEVHSPSELHKGGQSPTMPNTLMGIYLRAVALRDFVVREKSQAELVKTRWIDADAVLDEALQAALVVQFGAKPRLFGIAKLAAETARAFKNARFGPNDIEQVIKSFLGHDASLDDFSESKIKTIKILVFSTVVRKGRLTPEKADLLITEAERRVYDRGYRPTPNQLD